MNDVAAMRFETRLEEVFRRTLPKLGPEARAQLEAIMSPGSLAIIAGVLVAWVVSHAFGIGEVIDILIAALGVVAVGWAVFNGLDHLFDFALGTYRARSSADLDAAAGDLAKAIGILGIQAVLALLFRGAKAPRTGRGGRVNVGAPPPATGLRYKPTITRDPSIPAGEGATSWWGNIRVSTRGTATDQALVLLHEKVHQFLTPKLRVLRHYRVSNRAASYVRSSLWRYIEEALAETVAQVGVQGFTKLFEGIRFPVQNGYMFLLRGGGRVPAYGGAGALPEGAALLWTGLVAGIAFELRFEPGVPSDP